MFMESLLFTLEMKRIPEAYELLLIAVVRVRWEQTASSTPFPTIRKSMTDSSHSCTGPHHRTDPNMWSLTQT